MGKFATLGTIEPRYNDKKVQVNEKGIQDDRLAFIYGAIKKYGHRPECTGDLLAYIRSMVESDQGGAAAYAPDASYADQLKHHIDNLSFTETIVGVEGQWVHFKFFRQNGDYKCKCHSSLPINGGGFMDYGYETEHRLADLPEKLIQACVEAIDEAIANLPANSVAQWEEAREELALVEDDFWDIVKGIEWRFKSTQGDDERPYIAIHNELKKRYPEGIHVLRAYCDHFSKALLEHLERYAKEKFGSWYKFCAANGFLHGLSDDSTWYLSTFIVGCGKEAYNKVMLDPMKISEFKDYVEGFSYCF